MISIWIKYLYSLDSGLYILKIKKKKILQVYVNGIHWMEMRAQIYLQSLSQNQVCFLSISQTWQYIKDLTYSFAQANIKHINIFLKSTKGFQEPLWIAIPLNYASKIYLTELESQNLVKTISSLRFKKKKKKKTNSKYKIRPRRLKTNY